MGRLPPVRLFSLSAAWLVEAPSAAITSRGPGAPECGRRKEDEREGPIPRAYGLSSTSSIPKPDTNQRTFWGRRLSAALQSFLIGNRYGRNAPILLKKSVSDCRQFDGVIH